MIVRLVLTASLIAATGCATPVPAEDVPVRGDTARKCNAAPAQGLVGREASNAVGDEALRLTGAGAIRWIQPGQAVTMDYREDRLNIELDERNRVSRLRCG